jgi:ATP-binding cassette, subfamily C (CFTR/MRP), member 1
MEERLLNEGYVEKTKEEIRKEKAISKLGSQEKDIYINTNIFSRIFFYWAFRIIRLANITPLKNEYLGKMEGYNKSKNYIQDLNDAWERKGYKNLKKHALLRASIRANIGRIIIMIFLSLFVAFLEFSSVYLFRMYTKLYQKDFIPPNEYYTKSNVGIAFLLIKFSSIFFVRQTNIFQTLIGYKSANEMNCLIFNKVLKASPASLTEKSSEGEIINFLQVDSAKLAMVMTFCPTLIIIPIQIIVYTLMLFEFMGISFIFGFAALAIFLGINFKIMKNYSVLQKEMLKKKDTRMKVTTETFNHLKVLKLYGWEDEFLRRIEESRNGEIDTYRRIFRTSNMNLTMLWFAPVAVSIASIGAYQHFTTEMRIEDIFTCLMIFNAIQEPIRSLPWILNNLLELFVSMGRIEKYLKQEEIDPTRVIRDDPETIEKGVSIKIENGNFSWGLNVEKKDNDKKEKKDELKKVKDKSDNKNQIVLQSSDQEKTQEINKSPNSADNITSLNNETETLTNKSEIQIKVEGSEPLLPEGPRVILKNLNLEIKTSEFVCVIGEVGSGKSSILQAILNNMLPANSKDQAKPLVVVNGSISYVSQVPWIQNDTVKNNIIFHSEFDEAKYNYVLDICELKPDLEVLVGGDQTEIGEKGINLSGGQKARISIARAIYADHDIFLFDDPISALDAHVGQNVMEKCIVNYLSKKTRILVTHALQYLSYADRILYMENGEIKWQGTYEEVTHQDFFTDLRVKMKTKEEVEKSTEESAEKIVDTDGEKVKLIEEVKKQKEVKRITKDEDKEEGEVKREVYLTYIKYMGGWCLFFFVFIVMATWQVLRGGADLWLTHWTKNQGPDNLYYFGIYSALGTSSAIFVFFRVFILSQSSLKCSKRLHEEMIDKLVHAPINLYHDTIPKGQILNRLSKDLSSMDAYTMFMYGSVYGFFFAFVGCIVICSLIEPKCLIFLPFLFLIGWMITRYYISATRDLTRLDGTLRSPIINLLAETIPGSTTIRAFNLDQIFLDKFHDRVDDYYKIRYCISGVNQWFGMMLDLLSVTFFLFLIVFTVIFDTFYSAQDIGIIMTYSLALQDNLFKLLYCLSNFENCMVSMERCLKYTTIKTELPQAQPIDDALTSWPSFGRIKFVNYSVRYRPETDLVLKNLNFDVLPGEKVGVVGRTGSGKSTLCLALFRILEPSLGTIIIDDVDICEIGLKKLRTNLTIIPQDPNLMLGTLKYNIDPLNMYTDEEIKEVMQMIGFWYICENNSKGLEQPISENGSNLSVGEKQLICITRAILRVRKIK